MIIKEMMANSPDDKLIKLCTELHCSIFITECFGARDVLLYYAATSELANRGYSIKEKPSLAINK